MSGKPPRRPVRLRAQLALFALISFAGSFVICYGGILLFDHLEFMRVMATLPPEARRAVEAIEADQMPDVADFKALHAAQVRYIPDYERRQYVVLLILCLVAASSGALASLFLSRRLSRSLEGLADAARGVANGDLRVRAAQVRGPREIAQLIADFNIMAEALERGERKLREDAAAIAHELRTPLMVLQARLEALADGVFAPSPEEHRRLVAQTRLLGRIVEDLRMLSLARAGRLSMRLAELDLADIAAETAAGFATMAAQAQVRLSVRATPAAALGDRDRVLQCAAALVDNAIRYGASGGEVEIESRSSADGATLTVRDRGPGPPSHIAAESLFEAFVRGDSSRARETGGSGLGLAVVRAITEAHHGRIEAREREGGGAEFILTLSRPTQVQRPPTPSLLRS